MVLRRIVSELPGDLYPCVLFFWLERKSIKSYFQKLKTNPKQFFWGGSSVEGRGERLGTGVGVAVQR